MTCGYEGCFRKAVLGIEWWGLNQYGEDPEIVDEYQVCADPEHIIVMSNHNSFGLPDEIYDSDTFRVREDLLELVTLAVDKPSNLNLLALIGIEASPLRGRQLNLFHDYVRRLGLFPERYSTLKPKPF